LTNAPTFVIDPIDGTVNFLHTFPHACVSLGFAIGRVPVVGVVYNPFDNNLYSAIHGQGAFLNRHVKLPLKGADLQPLQGLQNSLIGIEWGSDRKGRNWETKVRTFEKLGQAKDEGGAMVRSMRSLGSAALNLCAVAAGTLDLYWEGGCWPWDVCAGWVILTEAGGIMVDGNPGSWQAIIDGRTYLAVRASPHQIGQKELVQEFWGNIQGRLEY
jgi:myo-inositol-1(or 4)-monophosphatase